MGLFDKLKGIVQGTQDAAAAAAQQQQTQAESKAQSVEPDAGQAGDLDPAPGDVGAEPCTLERYAEIGGAESAWAQQGRDVNAMRQQQFGIDALEWSHFSLFWSARIAGDYRIGLQYTELQTRYEGEYKARDSSFDDDPLV